MINTKYEILSPQRINQGDIYKDINYLDQIKDTSGILDISIIEFPYVFVLSQDCDLERDSINRDECAADSDQNNDKFLISVLVAPIYVAEHVFHGEHLSYLEMKTYSSFNRNQKDLIKRNGEMRYHYLEFDSDNEIAPSIIDFKHYFTVNTEYLRMNISKKYICSVSKLFRELICQRFSNYLSRIGLPVI